MLTAICVSLSASRILAYSRRRRTANLRERLLDQEPGAVLGRAPLGAVERRIVQLHDWWALRRDAERREGSAFNLCRYHDTVLSYGAVPGPTVRRLYFDHAASSADMPASRCNASD